MIVKATDIKNNFGKYLKYLDMEDIYVTKNGVPAAKITKHTEWDDFGKVTEHADAYETEPKKMTYEEFLEFYENAEDRYEFIDGELYKIASPPVTHQEVAGNLHILFHNWFKGKKCRTYMAPFDITLKKSETNINLVQPDLMVICDRENRNEKDRYTGIPVLVIEILSESTRGKDHVKKLDLYMQSGVHEYWIVDYYEKEIHVYSFKKKDIMNIRHYKASEIAVSVEFKGLEAPLDEIFES